MANEGTPLAGTETHYLDSRHVGGEFKIFVGHCGPAAPGEPRPVLYVTDANGMFGAAVDVVRLLQLGFFVPPLIVVGIGYRASSLAETISIRVRDLTPTVDEAFLQRSRATDPGAPAPQAGGAPRFLSFIRDELKPWVSARFDVDPADAAYFGDSLGGLFGTYALLTAPDTFQRYVLGSPSLWWDKQVSFRHEEESTSRRSARARVFLGVGGLETPAGFRASTRLMPAAQREAAAQMTREIDMVEDMERMVKRLASGAYPGLQVASHVFPDEHHVTVPPAILSRGLRFAYGLEERALAGA